MARVKLLPVATAVVLAATGLTTGSAAAAMSSPFCDPSLSAIQLVAADARDGGNRDDQMSDLAFRWSETDELSGWSEPDLDYLQQVVRDLVGLSRRAVASGDHLYCWVCV